MQTPHSNLSAASLKPESLPHYTSTSDPGGGVSWDVGVHGDLGVEDAAMGVGVHLQGVEQLSVVLHPRVVHAALLRDQLGSIC